MTLLRVVKKFQDYAKVAQCDITVIISWINAISIYTLTTEDPGGSSRLEDPRAIYNAKLIKYRFAFFEITHILSASEGLFPLSPLPELCRWNPIGTSILKPLDKPTFPDSRSALHWFKHSDALDKYNWACNKHPQHAEARYNTGTTIHVVEHQKCGVIHSTGREHQIPYLICWYALRVNNNKKLDT